MGDAMSQKPGAIQRHGTQPGAALVIVLVFLCVLSLTGASASLNAGMQERMAGNLRSRDLAFQAAEAALQDAANSLGAWHALGFDGSQQGLGAPDPMQANDAAYWRNAANRTSYRSMVVVLNCVAEQPRYRIDRMPQTCDLKQYRVTARGIGSDAGTVVVLQAIYVVPAVQTSAGPGIPARVGWKQIV
jgi:type IV pilus assembly protein PilX